jgi:hypothetical protein
MMRSREGAHLASVVRQYGYVPSLTRRLSQTDRGGEHRSIGHFLAGHRSGDDRQDRAKY